MELIHPKSRIYIINQTIKKSILVYGEKTEIYVIFDSKGEFIAYSEINCFNENHKTYKTTIESLYILLQNSIYSEIDFLKIKIIEKRQLYNLSASDMSNLINISTDEYLDFEEGLIELDENKRKVICDNLNIKALTQKQFFDIYFKQIR